MKYLLYPAAFALLLASCGDASQQNTDVTITSPSTTSTNTNPPPAANANTTIKGQIKGVQNTKVFLDKKMPDAHDVITSVQLAPDGSFEIKANVSETGIYRLRIGLASLPLILAGNENATISATIDNDQAKDLTIEGAPLSTDLAKWFPPNSNQEKALRAHFASLPADNPFLNLLLVERLPLDKDFASYQAVLKQLTEKHPNAMLTLALNAKVSSMVTAQSAGRIDIGYPAPDIRLPNPDGKELSLSSLKGKIVLLDFWASWCGPCRKENPHVVKIYQQYKDKGFTVYSVSLDGLDNNTLMNLQSNPDMLKKATDNQRKRWTDAITQDRLEWPNHVSDLRGWSSSAAALYGVNAIPRTFLLDKDGKIVAINLRGAALEQKVKEILK